VSSASETQNVPSQGLLLPGRPNLRWLGGFRLADGRRVRQGRFLRSSALTNLTEQETEWLVKLDPGLIVDFRNEAELAQHPVTLPAELSSRRLVLPIESGAVASLRLQFPDGNPPHDAALHAMTEMYRNLVRQHSGVFLSFLQNLSETENRPVLFHCTAGKDRTGVAAALILGSLGAPREMLMADYLATAGRWTPDATLVEKIPAPAREAVFGVYPDYLEAALEELDRSFGGIAAFAQQAFGGRKAHHGWIARHLEPVD